MSNVIDLRKDPRVDMANAQAIGNILAAVGKAEQNRQKRFQYDKVYSDILNKVEPMQAIANAQNQGPAPYGSGLAGVGQRFGGLLGGAPRDYTGDIKEQIIMGKLKQSLQMQDPAYQADLEARKAQTAATVQNTSQSAEMQPIKKTVAQNEANVSTLEAGAAPTKIEQQAEANDLAIKAKRFQVENMPEEYQRQVTKESQDIIAQKNHIGYDATTAERAGELHALMRKNEAEKDSQKVSNDLYTARKHAYELEGLEADNNYRKAMTKKALTPKVNYSSLGRIQTRLDSGGATPEELTRLQEEAALSGYEIKEIKDPDVTIPAENGKPAEFIPGRKRKTLVPATPATAPSDTNQAAPAPALSQEDTEALNWAKQNPQDPRAALIKQRLGVQ